MRAVVVDFHFDRVAMDVVKVSDRIFRHANVFFDELMCVTPDCGFLERVGEILYPDHPVEYSEESLSRLSSRLTGLLHEYDALGYLHTGLKAKLVRNRPGMIVLEKCEHFDRI